MLALQIEQLLTTSLQAQDKTTDSAMPADAFLVCFDFVPMLFVAQVVERQPARGGPAFSS
jgi:hypothetical protein